MASTSSTTDTNDKPINLYFGGLPQSGLLEGGDNAGSLKFIILQNDQLHQEVEKMKERVKELEDEVADLEASNDSLEKTRICLRGYIKNEHVNALDYKELYQNANNMFRTQWTDSFYLILNIFSLFMISNMYVNFTLMFVIGTLIYFDMGSNIEKYHKNKKILAKIKETDKADGYLDDLIDNM